MIFFDRNKVNRPEWFDSERADKISRDIVSYLKLSDREREQTDPPTVWKLKPHASIGRALEEVTQAKCAFCEQSQPTVPYRFRPPFNAISDQQESGSDHYIWLAWEWDNFFPICDDCKPSIQKISLFPVKGDRARLSESALQNWVSKLYKKKSSVLVEVRYIEDAILIHPGEDLPMHEHFEVGTNGYISALSSRARYTIDHFYLNRPELIRRRESVFKSYFTELILVMPEAESAAFEDMRDALFNFQEREFGGLIYLFLRRIGQFFNSHHGTKKRLTPQAIAKSFRTQQALGQWTDFDLAIETIERENRFVDALKGPSGDAIELESLLTSYSYEQPWLQKIHIKNFKSLENIELELSRPINSDDEFSIDREPCLLLLGENAAGKSSILESIALACSSQATIDSLQDEGLVSARKMILNPAYMASPNTASPKKSEVNLTFSGGQTRDIIASNSSREIRWKLKASNHSRESEILLFAYGAHRLFGNGQMQANEFDNLVTLFRNDATTIDPEKWIISLHDEDPEQVHGVAAALREIIKIDGDFENIEVQKNDQGESFCQIKLKRRMTATGRKRAQNSDKEYYEAVPTPLEMVSSGYRVIIALVCDILAGIKHRLNCTVNMARQVPVLVLIDEIEAHLHPRWKMEIISGLRNALPRATFILSSHDPLCLRGLRDGEVVALNRYRNEGRASDSKLSEVVEGVSEFTNIEHLTIEQLLTSDLFQLYSTDDLEQEKEFARIADTLAKADAGNKTSDDEQKTLRTFRRKVQGQVKDALPYGNSETVRIIQTAIEEYLQERRNTPNKVRERLRKDAIKKIKKQLEVMAG